MTTPYFALATDIGRAALANAAIAGTAVTITHLAVGTSGDAPTESQTALRNEVERVALTSLTNPGDATDAFVAEGVLPAESGNYTVREAGLFDSEGRLIAVASLPPSDKVSAATGALTEFRVRINVRVANADVVELTLDPSVIMASRQWVADEIATRDLRIAAAHITNIRNALVTDAVQTELTALTATLASLDTKVAGLAQDQIYTARRTV